MIKRFLKNNKAVAAIEFALVAPILFLMIFAILEFGLTLFASSTLDTSLRMLARYGMVVPYTSATQIKTDMQPCMGTIYRDNMVITMCAVPNIQTVNSSTGVITVNPTLAAISANPGILFTAPPALCVASSGGGTIPANNQINAVLIFAAQYPWGGVSGIMSGLIPTNLFAYTMLRSEYIPAGSLPPITIPKPCTANNT